MRLGDWKLFLLLDFNVKKSFQLVLDCDAGTLGFIQNGVWLGVAHNNLKVTIHILKGKNPYGFFGLEI